MNKILFILITFITTNTYADYYKWEKIPEKNQLIMIKYNSLYGNDLYILTTFIGHPRKFKNICDGWFNLSIEDYYIFQNHINKIHYVANDHRFIGECCELDHDIYIDIIYGQ